MSKSIRSAGKHVLIRDSRLFLGDNNPQKQVKAGLTGETPFVLLEGSSGLKYLS